MFKINLSHVITVKSRKNCRKIRQSYGKSWRGINNQTGQGEENSS